MEKYYFEMNEKEIKEAIKSFEKYLKNENSIIKNVTGVKPLEYCYTSSSSIAGVFLPNNEITFKEHYKPHYNFCCLGKNENDELGFWCSLKEEYFENGSPKGWLQEYIFIAFNPIDSKYFEIKERIKEDIKKLNYEIELLSSVRVVTKKDGSQFADYNKNFIFTYINKYTKEKEERKPTFSANHSWNNNYIYSIDVNFTYEVSLYFYLLDEEKEKYLNIESYKKPVEMLEMIQQRTQEKIKILEEKKQLLKDSLKIFKQVEAARNKYLEVKTKYYNLHYFNKYLEVESYETSK